MPPKRKRQKTTMEIGTATSLDDNDRAPPAVSSSSSSSSSSERSTRSVARIDPGAANLCREFLGLSERVSDLEEGYYIADSDSQETFEVSQETFEVRRRREGEDSSMEVVRRTETCHDLNSVTARARQDIRNEIVKRRQDIKALDQDIGELLAKLEETDSNRAEVLTQLSSIALVKGEHKKRIRALEAMNEVEVSVLVDRLCTKAVVSVSTVKSSSQTRKMVEAQEPCLYVLGGSSTAEGGELSSVEMLDSYSNKWQTTTSMTTKRDGCAAALLGRHVYAMGAKTARNTSPRWSAVASLITPRSYLCACVLNDHIYAIGGRYDEEFLSSVEKYDPRTNSWEEIAPMQHKRSGCAAAVLNGQIYVICGLDGDSCLSSVERYDQTSGKWELVASMNSERKDLAAAVLNGHIYAIGGDDDIEDEEDEEEDDVNGFCSVEKYDPALNRWSFAKPMKKARSYCAATVFNGQIIVTGGSEDTNGGYILSSSERYDPITEEWELLDAQMTSPRCSHAAVRGVRTL
eukprot:g82724.t1